MSKQKAYYPNNLRGFASKNDYHGCCNNHCGNGPTLMLQDINGECELVQVHYDDCGNVTSVITKPIDSTEVKSTNGSVTVTEVDPGCFDLAVNFPEIPMDVFVTDIIVQSSAGPNGSTQYQFCAVLNNGTKIPYGPVLDTIALVKSTDGSVNVSGPDADGCFDLSVTHPTYNFLSPDNSIAITDAGNGTFLFTVDHPEDIVQTLCCLDADGTEINVPVVNGKATIPYKPLKLKCELAAGGYQHVEYDAGQQCYVIPYKQPIINHSRMVVNGSVVTHTSGDGIVTSFDFCACPDIVTTMSVNGSTISYVNEDGLTVSFDICAIMQQYCPENVTSLVLNAAGDQFVYTNEIGVQTVVPFCPVCPIETITTLVNNGDNTYTYTNEANATTDIVIPTFTRKDGTQFVDGDTLLSHDQYTAAGAMAGAGDLLMGQDAAGNCLLFAPPSIEQDQRICDVRIVNTPANGQNVYSFEYDVCDINGNVVSTLIANDVPVPTFVDKNGTALTGNIEVFVPSDFAPTNAVPTAGTRLLGLNANGQCRAFNSPVVPTFVSKTGVTLTGTIDVFSPSEFAPTNAVAPTDAQLLGLNANGACRAYDAPPQTNFTNKAGDPILDGALLQASDFAAGTGAEGDLALAQDADGNCKLVPFPEGAEYQDWDGNVIDSESPIVTKNVIEDISCSTSEDVDGVNCMTITKCDGTEEYLSITNRMTNQFNGANAIADLDSATPLGPLAGSETCRTVVPGCCGEHFIVNLYHAYKIRANAQSGLNGSIVLNTQMSIDGGATYTGIGTGGSDEITDPQFADTANQGEISFFDTRETVRLDDPAVVCVRLNVDFNTLEPGALIESTSNSFYVQNLDMRCC